MAGGERSVSLLDKDMEGRISWNSGDYADRRHVKHVKCQGKGFV
jgi:hypothetical protein